MRTVRPLLRTAAPGDFPYAKVSLEQVVKGTNGLRTRCRGSEDNNVLPSCSSLISSPLNRRKFVVQINVKVVDLNSGTQVLETRESRERAENFSRVNRVST